MKLKKITITFKEPLTKMLTYQGYSNVTQEEIFYTDLGGIRAKLKREMNKILKGIDVVRKFGLDFFQLVTVRCEGINLQLDCLMAWNRDDNNPCIYYIYYPMDAEALLSFKDIGSRLPIFGKMLKGKDLHLARILQEKRLIDSIKIYSLKEMGIDPAAVVFETTEVEATKEDDNVRQSEQPKPSAPTEDESKSD